VSSTPDSSAAESPAGLRVLHVADSDVMVRFGRMFRELGLALSDEGVRVALLTDDARAAAALDGTPVEDLHVPALGGWRGWRLATYLRNLEPPPDLVHLWGTTGLHALSGWTAVRGAPLLIHCVSVADVERLDRRGVRPHEQVLAACTAFARSLHERAAGPIEAEAIPPALLARATAEEPLSRERTPGVLWCGKLAAGNGLPVLLQAVERLRVRSQELHLALIGRGPAKRSLWRELRARKLLDCVSLLDEPAMWPAALYGADILILPTCQRELWLAPLEAMAGGRLVIASRDQLADWLIEDQTCHMFAPGDADELAACISRAVARHPQTLAVTRAAAEYVRRTHTVAGLAARLVAHYRRILTPAEVSR